MKIILKAEKLKALRKSLRCTQKDFAQKAGVAESTYRGWELGGKNPATFHSLYKLCNAIKVDPRDYVENPQDLPAMSPQQINVSEEAKRLDKALQKLKKENPQKAKELYSQVTSMILDALTDED